MAAEPKKILIVDDEESARKLIIASLRKSNYQILQAEGGIEALDLSLNEHPDLIIMDICLAETHMDGLKTAQMIHRKCPNQAFLFVSGKQHVTIEGQIRRIEKAQFLEKPFSPIELRTTVRLLLD